MGESEKESVLREDAKTAANHTPVPWRVLEGHLGTIETYDGKVIVAQAMQTRAVRVSSDHDERKANAAFIVKACNSHAAMKDALEAWELAEQADAEHLDLIERATGEGWAYEPTGGGHIADAGKRATDLLLKARELRRAALALTQE